MSVAAGLRYTPPREIMGIRTLALVALLALLALGAFLALGRERSAVHS
ncbi:MAG: hypothetical protein HOP15_14075, partial [Planctomycetes bacterium]|nr:hypothetical protein [Planctomycetota bacterium]